LTGSDEALGLVDFSVFPHLEREDMPDTTLANIERWAAGLSVPAYAIDDQTAIKVVDGGVEVVSEGTGSCSTPSRPDLEAHASALLPAGEGHDRGLLHPGHELGLIQIVDGCRLDAPCLFAHADRRHRRFRLELRAADEHELQMADKGAG
jgi:hypothetical protein